ncbi:MAG: DNA photolyase [Alphaproteobacteria bacterium]|nr:DNA photolyase [Alphaproteobacteria bacterium]
MTPPDPSTPHPSRHAALDRLAWFRPRMGAAYAAARNIDLGPTRREGVSGLSPYLRHRLLLECEAVAAAASAHGPAGAETFIQEVFWRTYWKGWLERRPGVWRAYREAVQDRAATIAAEPDLAARLRAAEAGETGLDCFDFWARELVEYGYLHNHARLWFASLWIFTLRLPWELGADFFLRFLIDGDPASNTLGWRWVAGLQTPGKHYLARAENIARFTEGRFRPDPADLAEEAEPLVGEPPPGAAPPPAPDRAPLRLEAGTGLLLSEEDLHPESLPGLAPRRLAAVALMSCAADRSPGAVSPSVERFTGAALQDAGGRLEAAGAPPATRLDGDRASGRALAEWAERAGLRTVLTPYAPVGPAAERLAAAQAALAERGIALRPMLREWDARAWGHADRGFFRFRKAIPELMRAAGL